MDTREAVKRLCRGKRWRGGTPPAWWRPRSKSKKRNLGHSDPFKQRRTVARHKVMIAKATAKYIRMSPQKARLVVDLIRGKNVNEALMVLQFTNKRATGPIEKVVRSAVANATEQSESVDVDNLFVEKAYINEGPRLKRIRPAPMGRAFQYRRRMSHITIELGAKE